MDLQFLLQFVEQVKRVASFTVHLVDKDDDGRIAHAAYLHQLAGLRLHTLCRIHHDDGRVYRGERAIGIFGKVLVSRRVENVDLVVMIVKLHDRSRHRDTPLFLDIHPVRGGCFSDLVAFHCSCHLDLSSKEQEFLGECRLTGIRVRDDGKRSSAFYFVHCRSVLCLF